MNLQDEDVWSALMMASQNGHAEVVKILLENGAQVNLKNKSDRSAFIMASQNGHAEVIQILLQNGAQVNMQ